MSVKVEIEFNENTLNENLHKYLNSLNPDMVHVFKTYMYKHKEELNNNNWDGFWDESFALQHPYNLLSILVAILLKKHIEFELPDMISIGYFSFPGITSIKFEYKSKFPFISGNFGDFSRTLKRIYYPSTVTYIDYSEVYLLRRLNDIYYDNTISKWREVIGHHFNAASLADHEAMREIKVHCTDGECNGLGEKL